MRNKPIDLNTLRHVRSSRIFMLLLLLAALLAGCVSIQPSPLVLAMPVLAALPQLEVKPEAEAEPLCRLGINVSSFADAPFYIDDFDIAPLQAGWYIDYRAAPSPAANNNADYAMVVNVSDNDQGAYSYSPKGAALDTTIAAHPGGIYIIGNEPDRRELQNDVMPANYAYAYHDAYLEIKSKDPTARVWAGAIVQPTPLRLQYLDLVLAAYQARYSTPMPVDGWAIHAFLLNERDCDAFNNDLNICWGAEIPPGIEATEGQVLTPEDNARLDLFSAGIERFRMWMATNGYRNAPLFVSEYGVLMPPVFGFPPAKVNEYMRDTFAYMLTTQDDALGYPADENRLVQRFAWFSTFDPDFNGFLYEGTDANNPMNPPFVLSAMGKQFRDIAAEISASSDLALHTLQVAESPRRLIATIGNSGNRLAKTRAILRFYTGPSLAQSTQIGEDLTVEVAGCGEMSELSVVWEGAEAEQPTRYQIWAQISQPDFPDANVENNTLSNGVLVNGQPLFLPSIRNSRP
jgi:hypothetical protein